MPSQYNLTCILLFMLWDVLFLIKKTLPDVYLSRYYLLFAYSICPLGYLSFIIVVNS